MVYSRQQEQLAAWVWLSVMAIMGCSALYGTVGEVRNIFRSGVSMGAVSIALPFAGVALIGISSAVSSLLFILSGCQSEKRPRWLLLALCIGVVMIIVGVVGLFR